MQNWKRFFAIILCICLTISILCPVAAATESQGITRYADGSYSITTIICERQGGISTQVLQSEVSATKQEDHYNSSGNLLWTFYVHGTFTYDGRSAKATDADYSNNIYASNWSFERGDAFCSGATATATGQFKHILSVKPVTLRLTCSADGKLS